MIVFATIDRWLSSSAKVNLRGLSNMKNVRRSIIIVLVYACAINAPIVYCYQANLTTTLRACYGATHACRLTTDLIYAFATTLFPLLSVIACGLLTIKNIRQVQRRVRTLIEHIINTRTQASSKTSGQTRTKRTDRQLLRMLLAQVVLLFLLTAPHAIQKLYRSFSSRLLADPLESAIENLIFDIFTQMTFVASGMSLTLFLLYSTYLSF